MSARLQLEGQRFGRWTAVSMVGRQGSNALWLCRCECGSERLVSTLNLRSGRSRSCGCLRDEISAISHLKHGGSYSSEYQAWLKAKRRCFDPKDISYRNYGGRGIYMCDEWCADFGSFVRDVGPKPSPVHSLDRIDNDRGYEPGNCRWATRSEQSRNTRRNRWIGIGGQRKLLTDWSVDSGVSTTTIGRRLDAGWPARDAVFARARYACRA